MTHSEFEYLSSSEARELIERYILDDPSKLALKGVSGVVCSQIKYLQRCRKKLPLHYEKRCIIPALSFEQSSSTATAVTKTTGGDICIDLTCGLGVDTFYLSKVFQKVITVERDELLCKVASYNFMLLGATNIEVVNSSASEFLATLDFDVDLIYVDPARRDATKKVFLLEECSPDMNEITGVALKRCTKFMVKLSPLFDVDMAYSFFSKYGEPSIKSVSLGDECKEVIVTIEKGQKESYICSVVINGGSTCEYNFPIPSPKSIDSSYIKPEMGDYLYIPDVTFYKNRTTHALMQSHYKCFDYMQENQNSVVFSSEVIDNFEGERYIIKGLHIYKKRDLKRLFKEFASRVKLLKRDFPLRSEQIKKELAIRDGASPIFMFTTVGRQSVAVELEEF